MTSGDVRALLGKLGVVVDDRGMADCPLCDRHSLREMEGRLSCLEGCPRSRLREEILSLGGSSSPPTDTTAIADAIVEVGERWESPILFGDYVVPSFPVGALPRTLRAFVLAVAEDTQTPVDMVAMLVLAVVATCVQRRAFVQVNPSYSEPLSIFAAAVAESGERKSAVMGQVAAPLYDWEQEAADELRNVIEAARSDRRLLEQQQAAAEKRAANGKKDEDRVAARQEARALAQELAETPATPEYPRLLVDDVTPEALAALMAVQDERIGLLSPEGGIFETMGGRYSNGVANLDVFLKGHAGDPIRVDRKSGVPLVMNQPALTLGLAVQRDVIRGFVRKDGFKGRGLIARFCYVIPRSLVGRRRSQPSPVREDVRLAYREVVRRLLDGEMDRIRDLLRGAKKVDSVGLALSVDAERLRIAFATRIEPRLGPGGDLHHMADWGSKLQGATVRIAGLLHAATCAEVSKPITGAITSDIVADAVQIADYLIPHAQAAVAEMGADPDEDAERLAWERIQAFGVPTFAERDLFNALRGRSQFKKMSAVKATLAGLAERHLVRRVAHHARPGPGQPKSAVWERSPLAVGAHAQNPQDPQNSPANFNSADCADSAAVPVERIPGEDDDALDDEDGETLLARGTGT